MATDTSIEWADKTWSPIIGCDRVSPGCDACYAIGQARIRESNPNPKIASAFAGTVDRIDGRIDWTGKVNLLHDRLSQPLAWKKPRRVFVNSLSDLFHKNVPVEFIAQVFAVMALTPHHTYQILTKRHARMRSVLSDPDFEQQVDHALLTVPTFSRPEITGRSWPLPKAGWPLPNVHLGVSVENQQWADARIPALLNTPAAVRWISAEPLLGPIDLSAYLGDERGDEESRGRRVLGGRSGGPDSRSAGPDLARSGAQERPMEGRHADDSMSASASGAQHGHLPAGSGDEGRGPGVRVGPPIGVAPLLRADTGWAHDQSQERRQDGQPAGEPGTSDALGAADPCADGSTSRTPGPVRPAQLHGEVDHRAGGGDQSSQVRRRTSGVDRQGLRRSDAAHIEDRPGRPTIAWVVCGGETGAKARPSHPDWFRSLRDQCAAVDVPFFFKQWGDWGLDAPLDAEGRLFPGKRGAGMTLANDGTLYAPGDLAYPDGPRYGEAARADHGRAHLTAVYKVGKKAAGRELDGREHNAFPAVVR